MMSGGCASDNETFLGVGETLDEAFENVVHDIEEFFENIPQLKKVPSVHDALKKL
jgi:predicted RNase H-like HicB family nuclease